MKGSWSMRDASHVFFWGSVTNYTKSHAERTPFYFYASLDRTQKDKCVLILFLIHTFYCFQLKWTRMNSRTHILQVTKNLSSICNFIIIIMIIINIIIFDNYTSGMLIIDKLYLFQFFFVRKISRLSSPRIISHQTIEKYYTK